MCFASIDNRDRIKWNLKKGAKMADYCSAGHICTVQVTAGFII